MRENAVISKELRSLMRGGRAYIILTIYLGFLAFVTITASDSMITSAGIGGRPSFYIGVILFTIISFTQLVMTSFIAPSLTAGAFSKEREQQTYDLLILTKMSSLSLVIGKLFSAIVYTFLLISASLPVVSIVFLFGGVSIGDFLLTYILMIITIVFFASIGVFFSAIPIKTRLSSVLSSFTVLAITIGIPFFISFAFAFLFGIDTKKETAELVLHPLLILNPFFALTSILAGSTTDGSLPTSAEVFSRFPSEAAQSSPLAPDWVYTMIVYAVLTLLLLLAASRFVKPLNRIPGIRRKKHRNDMDLDLQD